MRQLFCMQIIEGNNSKVDVEKVLMILEDGITEFTVGMPSYSVTLLTISR